LAQFQSALMQTLVDRGFYYQATDESALDTLWAQKQPVSAYIGFDATADCLHVGSLVQIMMLYWMQQYGHRPIVLLGGGTTKIGDPSGKDQSRQLLDSAAIAHNRDSIASLLKRFLVFGEQGSQAVMVDNAQWLDQLNYIDFLRKVGPHFTINRMLTFDSVRSRLTREQPLTFLEFNYMLLQAYDFYQLAQQYDCRVQLGGSDQWGNIVCGVELARRMGCQQPIYGYTAPLLTTSDGKKMGKTAAGAVWLDPDRYSSYDFWQYWRNCADADVVRFLKLFTTLPINEIDQLAQLTGERINEAKVVLANAVTSFCHGEQAAQRAHATAQKTFSAGGMGDDLPVYACQQIQISVVDVLVGLGFAASNSAARRLISGGGVRIDNELVTDVMQMLERVHDGADSKIAVGKKRRGVLRWL